MDFVYAVLIVVGIPFVLLAIWGISLSNSEESIQSKEKSKNQFKELIEKADKGSISFRSDYDNLFLDSESGKINRVKYNGLTDSLDIKYEYSEINFKNIISSEVIIDNHTIVSSMRGSQAVGTLVGGALLGGLGAVIGGTTGKKSHNDLVSDMRIKLTMNNLEQPIINIDFLKQVGQYTNKLIDKKYKKSSEEYIKAAKSIEQWQGIFDVILKQQDLVQTK